MRFILLFAIALTGCASTPDSTLPETQANVTVSSGSQSTSNEEEKGLSPLAISIRRTVKSHVPEIKDCYIRARNKNPELNGKVTMDWTFGFDGKVSKEKINKERTDLDSPELHQCMLDRVKTWKFPWDPSLPKEEIVTVSYPFFFSE